MESDDVLPKMGIVTIADDIYAGVYWDREWNHDVWYTPYGRFFNAGEMDAGETVALLGMQYLRQLPKEQLDGIWETGIEIDGILLRAIGSYDDWMVEFAEENRYETTVLPTSVAMPLQCYLDLGLTPTRLRVVFSQPLTSAQREHLNGIL